ncbi:class I SAM-dependent methyltransferase [Anaeromicropila herbilytica]|uniref:Methyltransferase domain-containing protein n=1 Tax=Anaeromicropila herbilytica TaxID=2785025 RepID=A0A7R7EK53_9FIRM|nr:class I SAM-dependent methyltransferase [Anaeromicropila herbilytica]BCN30185.1 hypothetical protein bsdtb5_14800 [Anaeromicropila herbilytica]
MINNYRVISKFYDILDYIYFNKKERSPRQAILNVIPNDSIKILDVCTGTGSNSLLISEYKRNTSIYGIDLSKEMLHILKEKKEGNTSNNLKTFVMDATETKFKANTFDVVLISLVLHEVSDDVATDILDEAKRVLKPQGKIIVVEWEEPQRWIQKLKFSIIKLFEPKGFDQFLSNDFQKYFMRRGLYINRLRHCDYSRVFELRKAI